MLTCCIFSKSSHGRWICLGLWWWRCLLLEISLPLEDLCERPPLVAADAVKVEDVTLLDNEEDELLRIGDDDAELFVADVDDDTMLFVVGEREELLIINVEFGEWWWCWWWLLVVDDGSSSECSTTGPPPQLLEFGIYLLFIRNEWGWCCWLWWWFWASLL